MLDRCGCWSRTFWKACHEYHRVCVLVSYAYCLTGLSGNITRITPSRGYSIELGTALAVLIASFIGMPISSTHCAVGAVVAVGLLNPSGHHAVQWSLVTRVMLSWVLTLPVAGTLSLCLYSTLRELAAAVNIRPQDMLIICSGNCSALFKE